MLELNPLNYPICLLQPERLTPFSAWHEHIPFAMFLVDILRPDMIVELGTQHGDSYCAFCQAVKQLDLATRCYAIDTWQGDTQTGFYGAEVLESLRQHHDPRYGGFSRLIQSTFDDALPHFLDGTIDILHIDGYHTYDAVKYDFESWLPKLSPWGVVLFHDTNVHERDFGVWRHWREVSQKYPSYEFLHGYGLGVLAPGNIRVKLLQSMVDADDEDIARLRDCFFQLGHRWSVYSDLQVKDTALRHAKELLSQRDADLAHTQETLSQLDANLTHTQGVLSQRDADLANTQAALSQRDADLAYTQETLSQLDANLTHTQGVLSQRDADLANTQAALSQRDANLAHTQKVLSQRDADLAVYEETIRDKEEQWVNAHKALSKRDEYLAELQEDLRVKEEHLALFQELLRQRDEQVTTFQEALQARETQLTRDQEILRQRDEQVATFREALQAREAQLTHGQEFLRQRDEQVAAFQEVSDRAAAHIDHLEGTLHRIYSSRGWKALSVGYRIKNRLKTMAYGKGTYGLRSLLSWGRSLIRAEKPITFTCNICGCQNTKPLATFGRETGSCDKCRSTVRMRSIIHVLSVELFGHCLTLDAFPMDSNLKGLGMSDWTGYADPLATKLDYQNTFYHCEPQLDICHPDPALFGTLDFLIATDVFEHVPPPVERAFENARNLLKPNGVFVFSVPYKLEGKTEEHYPELHDYEIVTHDDEPVLVNQTRDGVEQRFNELVFHGGDGATLEMRLFSYNNLLDAFASSGFSVATYADSHPSCGMMLAEQWSLTMALRPKGE